MTKPIRVRLAPSPTGPLHIGTARTGLFNFLFARKMGGTFVLRIEDTDLERSEPKYEKDILQNLDWLGIEWDEGPLVSGGYKGDFGPYRQSERLDTYERHLLKLLEDGKAYYCFCSEEELEIGRQEMLARGVAPKYSGKCATMDTKVVEEKIGAGIKSVIRFRMPETRIVFHDLVRGPVEFDVALTGDIVIAKTPRIPLYNFAVVVDDYEMNISHVIRGEDHISNTPKQIALQQALGFPTPHYAHLPLILDKNRAKLSKRFNAVSLSDYKNTGYLHESLFNFIALLGWHPSELNTEIFSQQELARLFELERVQKAGAIFDIEKLNWINSHYIKTKTIEELLKDVVAFVPEEWKKDEVKLLAILELQRGRMKRLSEFDELARFFFQLPEYAGELLVWKEMSFERARENLSSVSELLKNLSDRLGWNKEVLEAHIMPFAEERGRGEVLWPFRVSLSGQKMSPGPFEIAEILGREETLQRIKIAIEKF